MKNNRTLQAPVTDLCVTHAYTLLQSLIDHSYVWHRASDTHNLCIQPQIPRSITYDCTRPRFDLDSITDVQCWGEIQIHEEQHR